MTAFPKHRNAVSQAVRDSAEGETCTLRLGCCNHDPATVGLCHIRAFGWAGMAQKPPDFLAVYACSACHDHLDRRASEAQWGWDDVLRALGETQMRLSTKGLLTLKGQK